MTRPKQTKSNPDGKPPYFGIAIDETHYRVLQQILERSTNYTRTQILHAAIDLFAASLNVAEKRPLTPETKRGTTEPLSDILKRIPQPKPRS